MTARKIAMFCLTLCLVAQLAGQASAARYDLNLGHYFDNGCDQACAQEKFRGLIRELGQVSSPAFLAPAETLGLNGFSFAFEGSVIGISGSEDFWQQATEGNPNDVLFVPRLHVRKGLPFSVELGTQLAYVPESEMFVIGAEIKWALNEGFYYIPDLAVRLNIDHMLGPKDFELSTGGWDISLSKAFGLGGMLSLTPYAGYHMLFVHGTSHVVLALDTSTSPARFVNAVFSKVDWQDNIFHQLFVGVRLTTFIFQVIFEGAFTLDGLSAFNFGLGLDY